MKAAADKAQRAKALDITQSFLVQAPAGSGKTELLIQRYLALLSKVQQPEAIIAITFTRKAAKEMRHRILQALQQVEAPVEPGAHHSAQTQQLARAALQHAKTLNWHLLENPQRLSINTIDALCAQLVHRMPILSRFGVQPTVTDYPSPLYEQAINYLLEALEKQQPWSQAMATLYRHLDNNDTAIYTLLTHMLTHREQWLPHLHHKNHDSLKKTMEDGLQRLIDHHLLILKSLIASSEQQRLKEFLTASAQQLEITWDNETYYWRYVSQTLLTTTGQWRKSLTKKQGFPSHQKAMKQAVLSLLESFRDNDELREALFHFQQLPPTYYESSHWLMIESLLTLLPVLTAQLQLIFQEVGEVDFQEMAQGALQALGTPDHPTDLALYYDYRIQHLLVDEFQDTSLSQYTFLKQLTAGWQHDDDRTLFFVGDPMQSIYRFRQAEVGLFLQVKRDGLGEKKCEFIALSSNFRSSHGLIHWFNDYFANIFPKVENQETGAISYSPSVAHHEKVNHESPVHWHFSTSGKEEANYIASTIQSLQKANPSHRIAILVRSRSHLHHIIETLADKDIPYSGVGLLSLWDIRAVRDIVTLFKALHHHGDNLSWLSLLRAPYIGLTLHDLHHLAQKKQGKTLWQTIKNDANYSQLSQDGQQRLHRIIPVLQKSMALRYQLPVEQWLKETWMALGGLDTVSNQESLAIYEFFKILQQYRMKHAERETDTLAYLCQQTPITQTSHHPYPIHIMTIHKSKGLEFDTVFIPQLQRRTHYDTLPLLHWYERPTPEGSDLLIGSYKKEKKQWPLYQYIHELQKKKGYYEAQRLLYVACTRAKQALYLCGEIQADDDHELLLPPKHSFLYTLWPQALPFIKLDEQAHLEPTMKSPSSFLYRLPHDWRPAENFSVTPHDTTFEKAPQLSIETTHDDRMLGIFYHELLQYIAENPQCSSWINNPS